MSMESQLLDRRKRSKEDMSVPATSQSNDDRTVKFSNLYGDDSDDDE